MNRIYHPWHKWECYQAGFYKTSYPLSKEEGRQMYCDFLGSPQRFEKALKRVINEWFYSCEHFLSNESSNRIAWLGQASMCIQEGLPCFYRGGFKLLSLEKQKEANKLAEKYLNIWLGRYEKKDKPIHSDMEEPWLF